MTEPYTRKRFEPLLGDTFHAQFPEDQVLDLELNQIREGIKPAENYECFSLLFRGPANLTFSQGLVAMKHPSAGDFAFFLVPIARDDDGFSYEAVFNIKLDGNGEA